jgi:hypothetical protein
MSGLTESMARIRDLLEKQNFTELLIEELGWDNPTSKQKIKIKMEDEELVFEVTPVATKKGMTIFHCSSFPTRKEMAQIDREISRRALERMIIFTESGSQMWRWPEPRKAGGTRYVNHEFSNGNPSESLVQRLAAIAFSFDEEKNLNILKVLERVRASFNSDEVTNKFYKEFEDNQKTLAEEIKGIKTPEDCSWYSSLLLNRLMFIYFMQRKGFLNDDPHYLRSSLIAVRDLKGRNKFYHFYKDFLLPLFHDGLGSESPVDVDPDMARIIGDVPYVNGGIFAMHELERNNKITVPDDAFERIFTFFDRYRWHLDERESAEPGEINPDVLGYIFEKYVNQKQQGAYYTKEDVTGYMSVNTILPVVIDRVSELVGDNPWKFISDQPLRYISESMRYGLDKGIPDEILSLPLDVYGKLDELADLSVGLPGERWRETLDRLNFVEEVAGRIRAGTVTSSAVALDLNLDLTTLFVDWVASFSDANHIGHVWKTLTTLNVLDPTCGSGAFLFAAMDVLEEIYEVAIHRASEILKDGGDTSDGVLRRIVDDMTRHPSPKYFLLKTIVLENIYGVDIMAEAIEIARLRLFLSLVARLQHRSEIEPLPDLDMNIKVGNILVGCSTYQNAEDVFSGNLLAGATLDSLRLKAQKLVDVYNKFVEVQRVSTSGSQLQKAKTSLVELSSEIREELDGLYASETGVAKKDLEKWKATHVPFHWFVEFPEALTAGGFDAVIGNPPYINKAKVTQYSFSGFRSDSSYDIFAPCMERAVSILKGDGAFSMIVPIAFQFSKDYEVIRDVVANQTPALWLSTFSRNPAALFDAAVGVRSSIVIGLAGREAKITTSQIRRWPEEYRVHLFGTLRYASIPGMSSVRDPWPRLGTEQIASFYSELTKSGRTLGYSSARNGPAFGFKKIALYYLSVYTEEPPSWDGEGKRIPQTAIGKMSFATEELRDIAFAISAGRIAMWWWSVNGDDFNLTQNAFESLPLHLDALQPISGKLLSLARRLSKAQLNNPLATKYAGKIMGNYDMSRCREITDEIDQLVLKQIGLSHYWPAILLADASLAKVTGERPGTLREWPYPL